MPMQKITPFLWYAKEAEEAAAFYTSIFPNSRVVRVNAMQAESPSGPPGSVKVVDVELFGQQFTAMTAGRMDTFNHAVSFMVNCDTQEEVDRYWDGLPQGGKALHEWAWPTRTFQRMFGNADGTTGTDDDFAARGFAHVGAWILGRNMFGPVRGPWPDESWKGWWGAEPPYHVPVFVLTHHPRKSLEMEGGTTFHFVTDGIESALRRAKDAANDKDVRIGGGVGTIQQYLRAKL